MAMGSIKTFLVSDTREAKLGLPLVPLGLVPARLDSTPALNEMAVAVIAASVVP